MSRLDKLPAAALLALVSVSALTTNAHAFQPRKHCDLLNWWSCSTHVMEQQVNRSRPSTVPVTNVDTDSRNRAMLDAGGGGGGGGGGGR